MSENFSNPLWSPSPDQKSETQLTQFMKRFGFADYKTLYNFSLANMGEFWSQIWDYAEIKGTKGDEFVHNPEDIEKAIFFPKGSLNYAHNLLRRQDDGLAIHAFVEDQLETQLTYKQLYDQVSQIKGFLESQGLKPGERVAAYMPNVPQTIVAMLATASLGGVFSSCSPDFGVASVIDRFSQIEPQILFVCESYFYGGKKFNVLERVPEILQALPSVKSVVIVSLEDTPQGHDYLSWTTILETNPPKVIDFRPFPFNHPLFILFSSGTTGKPKCITHGAGGTLLQHVKEHQLHCNITPQSRLFYFTTCGWMMWNWQVSALASGASLILYDGAPTFPKFGRLFCIAEKTNMTFLGTSAKYLSSLQKVGFKVKQELPQLKTIASTGSPLSKDTFEYVYSHIKSEVHLASISGGTDIISCFMLGNPNKPVYGGELQGAGLGMAVDVFDGEGNTATDNQGELVCTKPFPSRPLGFWGDVDGSRYHNAYFNKFKGVWHHGDLVEKTPHDGFIVHGRSDSVLNPGGVRIGTAEIYHQVEKLEEIRESLAIGQKWEDDVRVVLFVVLQEGITLDDDLKDKIRRQIKMGASPRHVPALILEAKDLPRTRNGKLAEVAARQAIEGEEIKNKEALANPEILDDFKGFLRDACKKHS
jgi:acetoacetyl-CoA synthetase